MAQKSSAIAIFFCYAHEDKKLLEELKMHLSLLKRQRGITLWDDGDISGGAEWAQEIKKHLSDAKIILLLISPGFTNSDYCYSKEMKDSLERHKQGSAIVIPVIVRPITGWQDISHEDIKLGGLQAFPTNTKAVTTWANRDSAWEDVVRGIGRVIEELIPPPAEPPEVVPPTEKMDSPSPRPMSPVSSITSQPASLASLPVAPQSGEISNPPVGPTSSNGSVDTPPAPQPEPQPVPGALSQPMPPVRPLRRRLLRVLLTIGLILALLLSAGIVALKREFPNITFNGNPTATHTPKKPLDVFVDELQAPFNLDTNTSPGELHGWYARAQGMLAITYPPHQSWGTISFTVRNPVPLSERQASPNHVLDLSAYRSLVFDIRLVTGEPYVRVGIKDWKQCDDGSESTMRQILTPQWTTVALPLNTFAGVDLTHLYVVFEVNFQGSSSITIDVRNIRYSPVPAVLPQPSPILPPFNVYTDWGDPGNHFVPSGWMGTAIDARANNNQSNCHPAPTSDSDISLTENWTANPHSGKTCIRVVFHAAAPPDQNWAGVYWQDPVNNWGKTPGPTGYDLSHISRLSFWVRGAVGGEQIDFLVGGITQDRDGSPLPHPDSATAETGYITLTTSWQQVPIPLTGANTSHIIGGFAWVTDNSHNPNGATFYLDDIIFM